ncbi:hypothetical protein F8M41_007069 [Gigaspora margarita]|uniref:Uncharacterized protein n=1 Tax=Gigaspora margarita TaxID=4874 RepID=A0A8H4AWG2_GIGMA|nr:hypothetical protein F8M41_007069 [Gigaspora margarita]
MEKTYKQSDEDILLYSNFGINEEKVNIHDPDSDYNILDDDSISSVTATENSGVGNIVININNNNDNEINLFTLDESALERAKLLANEKEIMMMILSVKI